MTSLDQYFSLLGLQRGCSTSELKKAYRQKALQFHPDRNPAAGDVFKGILHAYEELQHFFQQNGGKDNPHVRFPAQTGDRFSSYRSSYHDGTAKNTTFSSQTSFQTAPIWGQFQRAAAAVREHEKAKRKGHSSSFSGHPNPMGSFHETGDADSSDPTQQNTASSSESQWWRSRSHPRIPRFCAYAGVRTENLRKRQPSHTTSDFISRQFTVPPFTSIPKTLDEMDFLFDQLYCKHPFTREVLPTWEKSEKDLYDRIKKTRFQALWAELKAYAVEEAKRKMLRAEWAVVESELHRYYLEETSAGPPSRRADTESGDGRSPKEDPLNDSGEGKERVPTASERVRPLRKELEMVKQRLQFAEEAQLPKRRHLHTRGVSDHFAPLRPSSPPSGEEKERSGSSSRKDKELKQRTRRNVLIRRIVSEVYLVEEKELEKLSDVEIFTVLTRLKGYPLPSSPASSSPTRDDGEKSRRNPSQKSQGEGEEEEKKKDEKDPNRSGTTSMMGAAAPLSGDHGPSHPSVSLPSFSFADPPPPLSCASSFAQANAVHLSTTRASFITPQNILLLEKVLRQRLTSNFPCSHCHVEPKSGTATSPFICNHPSVCRKCMRIATQCPLCGARGTTPSSLADAAPLHLSPLSCPPPPSFSASSFFSSSSPPTPMEGQKRHAPRPRRATDGSTTAEPLDPSAGHPPIATPSFPRSKCLASIGSPSSRDFSSPNALKEEGEEKYRKHSWRTAEVTPLASLSATLRHPSITTTTTTTSKKKKKARRSGWPWGGFPAAAHPPPSSIAPTPTASHAFGIQWEGHVVSIPSP